jgi:hypothetical protein
MKPEMETLSVHSLDKVSDQLYSFEAFEIKTAMEAELPKLTAEAQTHEPKNE